jgi:D-lactate dehydrogenase (cytochrome)
MSSTAPAHNLQPLLQTGHNRGPADIAGAIAALRPRFGDRLQTGASIREQHAHTLTWLTNQPPDAVIFAQSTEEVADVVRVCSAHRTPIIPFGAGSSLEGQLNAPRGGISLDMTNMNKIISVNVSDLDAVVEAGVSRKALNDHLRDTGLFFSVDPGADYASRHGLDARVRHNGGSVRDNARERAVVESRDGRRVGHPDAAPRAQVGVRL